MMRVRSPDEDSAAELRARLRDADPMRPEALDAADEELALSRIAARIAAERGASARRSPARRFAFGVPALALVTVAAVAWLGVRFAERSRSPRPEARTANGAAEALASSSPGRSQGAATVEPASVSGSSEPESRQIQFETAGGTRVIWVLDPRFTL